MYALLNNVRDMWRATLSACLGVKGCLAVAASNTANMGGKTPRLPAYQSWLRACLAASLPRIGPRMRKRCSVSRWDTPVLLVHGGQCHNVMSSSKACLLMLSLTIDGGHVRGRRAFPCTIVSSTMFSISGCSERVLAVNVSDGALDVDNVPESRRKMPDGMGSSVIAMSD